MIFKHKIIILLLFFWALMCVSQTWALPLTANGRAAGRIYLARQALPGEKTAAAELQNYLGRISGCEFFISQKMSGCCIILGTVDTPGIPPEAQQMLAGRKDESYWLKTGKNRLYIIGKTQVGTLYGVYGLLSDHLGVCWFNPAEEFVPRQPDIVLKDLNEVQEPYFLWRSVSQTSAGGLAPAGKRWAARNRLQCASGALHDKRNQDFFSARNADHTIDYGGHLAFYNAVPPQKYLSTHPEYFALVGGKRLQNKDHNNTHHCLSNPQVRKLTAEHVTALHKKYGKRITYLFGAPDSEKNWCECANCRALDSSSRLDLARRFHSTVYDIGQMVYLRCPDAQLDVWAYANYRQLPENFKFDPRMSVYFCTHGRCYAHTIDDKNCMRNVEIFSLLQAWLQLNPRALHLYEYAYCTPPGWAPLEEVLAADLKTYRAMNIAGWKEEISFADANFRNVPAFSADPHHAAHRLRSNWLYFYIAGKLTWNPDLDVKQLISEVESKYYGTAYPAMRQFHELRRAAWRNGNGCFGYPRGDSRTQALLMQPGFQTRLLALLDQAEALADGDAVTLQRIKNDREYLELFWIKPNQTYRKKLDKTLNAALLKSPVNVDGSDSDPAWTSAGWTGDFKLIKNKKIHPLPAELQTFAGVLADREKLYFLIVANRPEAMRSDNERVEITLDPRNNSDTCYRISVNTDGTVSAATLSGKKTTALPGVTARIRNTPQGYTLEIALTACHTDGVFAPGALWKFNIIRQGRFGRIALDGVNKNQRSRFRTLFIDRARLVNSDFSAIDRKTNQVKNWNLKNASPITQAGKHGLQLAPHGSCNQLIWDWKGLLGQSEQPRKFRLHIRASGRGTLQITAPNYHDDWSNGKLTRKYHGSEKIGSCQLSGRMRVYSFDYTIKADRWIALTIYSDQGATLESVCITQE